MSTSELIEVRRQPEAKSLRLTWTDQHSADFDYDYLRGFCPCAGCQGHGTADLKFVKPMQPVEPLNIQPVGNYAISIQWSDGHDTGIYRFDFLRSICPCDICRTRREEAAS